MEEQSRPPDSSLFGLTIDINSKAHLSETAGWTKFLAIAGFIFIGLMITWGSLMPELMKNSFPTKYNQGIEPPFSISMYRTIMITYMVIIGTIYFFPCLFALRFSNKMKRALRMNDQELLISGFKNLKITARYIGIVTIICLSLFVVMLLIFILTVGTIEPTQSFK